MVLNLDCKDFLDNIFDCLEKDKVDVSKMELDHICYRVETKERYAEVKQVLLEQANLLSETLINGRPICSFKLKEPFFYKNRTIYVLELPSPKKGSPYKEGFEHLEFVTQTSLEDFLANHKNLDFDLKGFTKETNRDIRLIYDCGSVKFHEHSLEYVIKYLD